MDIRQFTISEYAQLTAYIHTPDEDNSHIASYPAILILPGGGFFVCSKRESEPVAMAYFAHGYQAFVLKYTTVSEKKNAKIEDPIMDVKKAISLIRTKSKELYTAENKLAMLGFSGGGHLAAAYCVSDMERPDCLLLGYPGIVHSSLRALEYPNITQKVDKNMPPCFMFATSDDTVTPPEHVLAMAGAYAREKLPMELHIFENGTHGLSLATWVTADGNSEFVNDDFAKWLPLSFAWLKKRFTI